MRKYPSLDELQKKTHLDKFSSAADKFRDYFETHRIYFDEGVFERLAFFNEELSKASSVLAMLVEDGKVIEDWMKSR